MEYLKTLHSLCVVLGVDFKKTISEIHPSLDEAEGPRNISNTTIEMLALAIQRLRETKMQRMQKVCILLFQFREWPNGIYLLSTNCISSASFKILHLPC